MRLFFQKDPAGVWHEEWEWEIQSSAAMRVRDFWVYSEQCRMLLLEIGGYLDEQEGTEYWEVKKMFENGEK